MQKERRVKRENYCHIAIYAILLIIPAGLVLLQEYIQVGQLCRQGSDARVYISVAENFLRTGHFIQTARPFSGMVVPPGTPLAITLFRLLKLSNQGIMIIHALMFGVSNILLYETEKRITGKGIWSPAIYTLAYMRCGLRLGVVMVEHYYMTLLCLAIWLAYKDMPRKKKMVCMNAAGIAMVMTRPLLIPVYLAIVLYTLHGCITEKNGKIAAGIILLPVLVFAVNIQINYKETGEVVPLENYSGYDFYLGTLPDAPVTIESASNYYVEPAPELKKLIIGENMTMTERNNSFKLLARENLKNYWGEYILNGVRRGYELFVRQYFWLTLYVLAGGVLLSISEWKHGNLRSMLMLGLTLLTAVISSFGASELRYSCMIWPMASVHGGYLTNRIITKLRQQGLHQSA